MGQFFIVLLHPFAASFTIWFILRQYGYRKKRKEVRGEEAKSVRENHERAGELAVKLAIGVVLGGLVINALLDYENEGVMALFPSHVHGWFGLMGLTLFLFLARKGRETKRLREAGESFSMEMRRHSRAADVIILLMVIHAFLGFIYLFKLLA